MLVVHYLCVNRIQEIFVIPSFFKLLHFYRDIIFMIFLLGLLPRSSLKSHKRQNVWKFAHTNRDST